MIPLSTTKLRLALVSTLAPSPSLPGGLNPKAAFNVKTAYSA